MASRQAYPTPMSYDDEEDEEFDYDEFVEREFGTPLRSKSTPLHWQLVAIGLLVLFALYTWMSLGLWMPF
ncbi:hypothetical protein Enr13x_10420 [Stieleria neptunia]|uniref:Uncharacterized protein n=2 Tax=Stieleria neptunia TaxID=2527979 RepID=A0A518HK22_9BACT|nr:hypothetical protein Enr13x_10420 [Stieleria neptunia]